MTTRKHLMPVLVAAVGCTMLALGSALIVLPDSAVFVIPAGLALLAVEFVWAGRWLRQAREGLPGKHAPQSPRSGVLPCLGSVRRVKP